ncbi:phosphoribosyltransferase [Pseudoprevotella muciniphila]|uniref:phosphoribosyltransferase n=1 Tax=Pseudoprevotella muciniphila TaxID=2133944 RepID=UPI000DD06DA7|nr:phosphoribosyltransferase [Pseudoprevotella muciniphila]
MDINKLGNDKRVVPDYGINIRQFLLEISGKRVFLFRKFIIIRKVRSHMTKKIIKLTKSKLNDIISEEVKKVLKEGIDIDTNSTPHTVGFNPNHQEYVDTNDPWNPQPIYNKVNGYNVISVFMRKKTNDKYDANPLLKALKGHKDWELKNEHYDIMSLLRRFVAVTKELNDSFDVIITTPSNNSLNNSIFNIVKRIIPHSTAVKHFFTKYEANYVFDYMIDDDLIAQMTNTEEEYKICKKEIERSILKMNRKNDGIFSYKYIEEKYRQYVIQSMFISDEVKSNLELANDINGKRILVLDDTVTSGKTISDSAEALMETFDPSDITFLTLFSPLT